MKFVKTQNYKEQTMLCAKYDYKMDIAVKQEEAREEKAEEDAIALLNENIAPEIVAKCIKLPLEKVLELKEKIPVMA